MAVEAEVAALKGEQGELYRITRQLAGKFNSGCEVVKSKDGVKKFSITFEEEQLQRRTEHFKEVLNRPDPAEQVTTDEFVTEELTIDCSPPTKGEITKSIRFLKNNKAPGLNNITSNPKS